jgi:fumarate hydratase class II
MGEIEVPADRYWGAQTSAASSISRSATTGCRNTYITPLKEAALRSGTIHEERLDEIVDPKKMVGHGVAGS